MKLLIGLLTHLLFAVQCHSQMLDKDYAKYHKGIIDAEQAIFVDNDSLTGLRLFKKTFSSYDFVFVDDCVEALQLALIFKREDYAMFFVKRAIDNGLELKALDYLTLACQCNGNHDFKQKVVVHQQFVKKNQSYLDAYAQSVYIKYLQKIDKELVAAVLKLHIRTQLYKNYHHGLSLTMARDEKQEMKNQEAEYLTVVDNNLAFLDSLFSLGIYLGEKNLGVYTAKQITMLKLPFGSIEELLQQVLDFYRLPRNTWVPIISEQYNYFEQSPLYLIMFNNEKTFDMLTKYKDDAIRKGFLHPREYASLKYNHGGFVKETELYLSPRIKRPEETININKRRATLLLPTYESDYNKHEFAHKHSLQLLFGKFKGTR